MATLTLLPNKTWFKPSVSTVTKSSITTINIVDAYSLSSSETVTDSWDASEDTDGSIMVYVQDGRLIIAGNGSGKIYANADSSKVFAEFNKLESITGANLLDTSNTTTLYTMFLSCASLTEVEVSNWNTENVTDMGGVFSGCSKLTSLNLSKWDTSKVTSFLGMFQKCESIEELDLSHWNTTNVTNIRGMFNGCNSLKTLNLSNWDTSKITSWNILFQNCSILVDLDITGWVSGNVTNMSHAFNNCNLLTSINTTNWDTSKVTTMRCMFQNCKSLIELNLSDWNTSNVTDMGWLFYGCSLLTTAKVSNWNTSKVINMRHVFAHCAKLTDFDVSNWDTSSATSIDGFFHSTKKIVYDISKWDTSKCLTVAQLFEGCSNAEKIIGLEKLNTSKTKKFLEMFNGCSKLTSLDLSNFDMRAIDDSWVDPDVRYEENATSNMLNGLTSLKVLKLGQYCNLRDNSALSDPSPDNYWYAESTGIRYKSANIPQGVAETYLADSPEVLIKSSSLYKIADAIREATGSSDTIKVSEMGNLIQGNIATTLNEISAGITDFEFTSTPESLDPQFFAKCTNLKNIYCTWEENAIEGAPWGAPDTATIWYEGGQPDFES